MKVHQMREFTICTNSQGGHEKGHLMSKLHQVTGVHFPDLNPNYYDNLNKMKLYRFKCLHQGQV